MFPIVKILALFALFVVLVALLGAWLCRAPAPLSAKGKALRSRARNAKSKALRAKAYYAVWANPRRKNGPYDQCWTTALAIGL